MERKSITELKREVCDAGRDAAEELIKIAKEPILISGIKHEKDEEGNLVVSGTDDDLSADKLTRAAQAKKICIMDAFEILDRVDKEELAIASLTGESTIPTGNLAERHAK